MKRVLRFHKPEHSYCSQCARTYYDKLIEKCAACGGLCFNFSSHDMELMQRRPSYRADLVFVARGDKLYES